MKCMIPCLNYKVFQQILEEDLNIINNSQLSLHKWEKFKLGLLQYEKEWNIPIFNWGLNPNNTDCPYVFIDINWGHLNDQSTRYFQIHMAFQDIWVGDEPSSDVWEQIDAELQ